MKHRRGQIIEALNNIVKKKGSIDDLKKASMDFEDTVSVISVSDGSHIVIKNNEDGTEGRLFYNVGEELPKEYQGPYNIVFK